MKEGSWIGVDFDGCLAHYDEWQGPLVFGDPVPLMAERVKAWIAEGIEVRIVTARADNLDAIEAIGYWCEKHLGKRLEVTRSKDFRMDALYDDRAVQLIPNTGILVQECLVEQEDRLMAFRHWLFGELEKWRKVNDGMYAHRIDTLEGVFEKATALGLFDESDPAQEG